MGFASLYPSYDRGRHCEPTGRANARPMTGSAKQSISPRKERMDCFVARAPRKAERSTNLGLPDLPHAHVLTEATHRLYAAPLLTVALDRKQIIGGSRIMPV